jgi:DNA-binding NarL/FixJ family response regulator
MRQRQLSRADPGGETPGTPASPARILYVDADPARSRKVRAAIEIAGFGEPEFAATGDEALDILGARAQQFDVVAAWMPLADTATVDLPGVLRRCRSPVRFVVLTTLTPRTYPLAGKLAGAAGVDGTRGERGIVQCLRAVLASPHTIAHVVASQQVPDTLSEPWATRIYGHQPGATFSAKLD